MICPLICTTNIDWSATGTWFGVFATGAGVVVALRAMNTWENQIRLQDRYQKADALLQSYILCIRAGCDWQLDCGVGENREPLKDGEKFREWQKTLMSYRLNWDLAHPLFEGHDSCKLSIHPDQVQSQIIGAGGDLFRTGGNFYEIIGKLGTNGTREIIKYRNLVK
ncbi:MAG: hypothetical protein PHH47_08185 [Gallionella sp.]|nr:hypothetical protein [Gallionella sp.]MDD4947275.1 hypothetical protein [Gallionella sp.]